MRWLLLLIVACGRVDLHAPEDPPPPTCNGNFTWSDAAPFTQSVTAFRADSTLVVRLTEAKNACAEVLADGGNEVLEIAVDGAAAFCAACTSTSCSRGYQQGVRLTRISSGVRTDLGVSAVVFVTCDPYFVDGKPVRLSVDWPNNHFMVITPTCVASCP